jgi:hypothetical protein
MMTVIPVELTDSMSVCRLVERIHSADLLVYHRTGHTPRWEHPTRFARDVTNFIEQSPETGP